MKKKNYCALVLLLFLSACKEEAKHYGKDAENDNVDSLILFSRKSSNHVFVKQQSDNDSQWKNKNDILLDTTLENDNYKINASDLDNASSIEIVNFNEELLDTSEELNAFLFNQLITLNIESIKETSETEKFWKGNLSQQNSIFTIYKVNETYSGWFFYDNEQYQIKNNGDNYLLLKIDQTQFIDESEPLLIFDNDTINQDLNDQSFNDDGNTIDILICYSSKAKQAAGGKDQIESFIKNTVVVTNLSYTNSNVSHKIRLVGTHELTKDETGIAEKEVDLLKNNSNVKNLRDQVKADIVMLFVEDLDSCGIVYAIQSSITPSFQSNAYGVVKRSCALGYYSLAHEIGHLMGCRHNCAADNNSTPYPYSHGYAYCGSGNKWRTIMSYNKCGNTRIPFWSNPNIKYNNHPMGEANGSCTSNNTSVLNNSSFTVANFRQSENSNFNQ
ncbi:M12 family metallo-peptidase [uncultured Psychroserpens sp.]|uniref:M12 family metallo-peptidase n=1 Tax=uncultured Psychroserpens sp. TaxID=255436 RepID=UPI002605E969|nr:M12 family metallo-peptidase [uncultured Psychroserpens sp.]